MPRPSRTSLLDLPISTIAGVDNVGDLEGILRAHDFGIFQDSAMLADATKKDDRISGVMSTRVGALTCSPLTVKAANSKRKAQKIAEIVGGSEGTDEDPGIWNLMFPVSQVKALLDWGLMLGVAVAQVRWGSIVSGMWRPVLGGRSGGWVPRISVWHPQFIRWDGASRTFAINTAKGQVLLPRIDENPQGDGNWLIWCPYGYQQGSWLSAMLRSLANAYLMRQWNYRDWARFNERHGQPVLGGKTPPGASDEAKEKFHGDLSNLGSNAAILLPQSDEHTGYGLEMIESQGRNWESFDEFKADLDSDIAIRILGQNLTTEVKEGSRAAERGHEKVALDKAWEDAMIAGCFREQVLTHWAEYNYGDAELAPRPSYQVGPPEDELEEATAIKTWGDALKAHKDAASPIDERAILDRAGIAAISEEEQAAKEAVRAEEAAAAGEVGGEGEDPQNAEKPEALRAPLPGARKRYTFQGLPIAVENEAGSLRIWRDGAVLGSTKMLFDYGYIEGHVSGDDEELDVYVGPDSGARDVHIIHQMKAPEFRSWDEDKTMLGFSDAATAKAAYLAHRNDGERAFGGMSVIPLERFVTKLERRTSTGKIRATAVRDTVGAIIALVDRHQERAQLRAPRSAAGRKRAKLYSDQVTSKAKLLAARALAVDVADLKAQIDQASSFEDLERRIVAAYRNRMSPEKLAKVVEKSRLMARLGGSLSVLQTL